MAHTNKSTYNQKDNYLGIDNTDMSTQSNRNFNIFKYNKDFVIIDSYNFFIDCKRLTREDLINKSIFDTMFTNFTGEEKQNFIKSFDNSEIPFEYIYKPINFNSNNEDDFLATDSYSLWFNSKSTNNNGEIVYKSIVVNASGVKDSITEINQAFINADDINFEDAEIECAANGMIIKANDRFIKMMNIPPSEDITERHFLEFIDVRNFIEIPELKDEQLLNKKLNTDIKCITTGLNVFWANIDVTPKYNGYGQHTSSTVVIKEMNKNCSKNAKYEQESPYIPHLDASLVYDHIDVMFLILDDNLLIKYISNNFWRILNLKFDLDRRLHVTKYIHPDDRQKALDEHKYILNNPNEIRRYRIRYLKDNNEYVWLEVNSSNQMNNPAIKGILINIKNVTSSRKNEELLYLLDNNLKTIFKNSNLLFLLVDFNGKIIFAEGKLFATIGVPNPNILFNMNLFKLPGVDDSVISYIKEAGNNKDIKANIKFRNHYFDVSFSPYYNIDNELTSVIIVSTDITSRINAIKDKENLIKLLQTSNETIIEESDRLIDINGKLSRSEEILKKMNSGKDKFFSIISHDLRSPLSGIVGTIKSIVKDFESYSPMEIKESMESLQKSSISIYELLEELLIWSRVQRGVMVNNPDLILLRVIVNNVYEVLNNNAITKNISLTKEIEDENQLVYTDFNMANTTLRNLVSNAIKFTPNGGKILIKTKKLNDQFVLVSVIDSGVGMTQFEVDNLFNISETRTTPGTDNESGSGLGLILCKEMIEQIGGEITVKSELGKGTDFSFTLPLNEENSELLRIKENRQLTIEEANEELKTK